MSEEELININGIREELYQAMQIGDITLSSKHSQELYDFMNYQDKEIERLNNIITEQDKELESERKSRRLLTDDLANVCEIALKKSNIINELEKYIVEKEIEHNHNREISYRVYKDVENKLKELKENK